MKLSEEQTKTAKGIVNLGIFTDAISVVILFALENNKIEFIKELRGLVDGFQKSLVEEEREELKRQVEEMIDSKARNVLQEMGKVANDKEIDGFISQLKESVGSSTSV